MKKTFQGTPYTEMPEASRKLKSCAVCETQYIPKSGAHKFCSESCKGKWKYITGIESTENQYSKISGNWKRYFQRLRGKSYRSKLSTEFLLKLLEKQNGKCALSGIKLTCQLEVGKRFKTNASIDRIIPGNDYTENNVQLVCSALNSWRADTDLTEFIWFCKQVTNFQEGKE